jgi:hypothetical protein
MKNILLLKIKKSDNPDKKYDAIFEHNGRHKKTSFGAAGMSDYTKHHDDERKQRYLNRHRDKENWNNPMSAGALSRYILWNKTSLKASINDYKKRFNL